MLSFKSFRFYFSYHDYLLRLTPNGQTLVYFENDLKTSHGNNIFEFFVTPGESLQLQYDFGLVWPPTASRLTNWAIENSSIGVLKLMGYIKIQFPILGSVCGSFSRAVASDSRGSRFESLSLTNFMLLTVLK